MVFFPKPVSISEEFCGGPLTFHTKYAKKVWIWIKVFFQTSKNPSNFKDSMDGNKCKIGVIFQSARKSNFHFTPESGVSKKKAPKWATSKISHVSKIII